MRGDYTEAKAYLRAVIGAPLGRGDTVESTEPGFVSSAADWAKTAGVDRQTLLTLGVPPSVLDRAGIAPTPVVDLIREFYGPEPFSVSDLARRACVSEASVRKALAIDERAGLVRRHGQIGRAVLWQEAPR